MSVWMLVICYLHLLRTKKLMKGTESVPFFFTMTDTERIQQIESLLQTLIAEKKEVFIVSVRIKPTNNIKIFLDADNGINIDTSAKINRSLYRIIEEKGWYPDGNFSLEVSSPGLDEPLKLLRQYHKNIGRMVEALLEDNSKLEGKLLQATEEAVEIEVKEGKNKKALTLVKTIPFKEIKQVKILVSF